MSGHLGPWVLAPIFLVVALESSAFFGLVFPGEAVAFVAGALAGAQIVSVWAAFAAVSAGAVVGDLGGYLLGRFKGPEVLAKSPLARRAYRRSAPWVESHFQRWGAATVLAGRFVAVGRALVPFAAGLAGMPARRFAAMAVLSAVLWSATVVSLGYMLGSNWAMVEGWLASVGLGMVALLVLTALAAAAYKWLAARQTELTRWWQERVAQPLRVRYGVDLARVMEFIRARFSPTSYVGLHLTVGLVAVAGLAWLFGGIAQDIFAQDPLVRADRVVALLIAHSRTPVFDSVMAAADVLNNPFWLCAVVAVAAAGLIAAKNRTMASVAPAVVGGAYGLGFSVRALFRNFHPHVTAQALVHGFGGFPSVAMTAATAAYGFVWLAIMLHARGWRVQMLATVAAVYVVLLAGLDALYRGQLLSAAGAGFALGGAWLAVCVTAGVTYERLRSGGPSAPP